jgi:hypothetical protein
MSQHDGNIANDTGQAVRSDINNALGALFTLSSGASAPATTIAHMLWADTTNNLLKQRNAANTVWFVRGTLAESFVLSRSSNTIIGVGDFGRVFLCTSTFTQTLTAAATLGDGFYFWILNDGTGIITLDPNASETINGATTLALYPGQNCAVFCNGSSFKTIGLQPLEIKQNSQSVAYTTVLSDAGKHILHPTADNNARTFTIDSNANVAYPIGTCITFANQINTVTIAITSDTLTLAGAGTTGSRTLAANGIATALKIASTSWIISGTGLT